MRLSECFRSSCKSLTYNKLRSSLTMLGIIIGISSVIMLTSIGEGLKKHITRQVESLGSNCLYVLPGKVNIPQKDGGSKLGVKMDRFGQNHSTLLYEDVEDLRDRKNIYAVSGVFNNVDHIDKLGIPVSTTGVDEDLPKINKLPIEYGRFINKQERQKGSRVAVIGHQANAELFQGKNSVGKHFKLNGSDYQVVGILSYRKPENFAPHKEDLNVKIYLPITEVLQRQKVKNISQIIVQAANANVVSNTENILRQTLNKRHKDSEYSILKQQDMLNVINKIMSILTTALGGIAAISLIVGGIGIMNIMLVSVTERTREIGIRKAIGATRLDILFQFLIEAIFISITGGTLGLLLGVGGSLSIPNFFPDIHTAISIPAVVVALTFSLLVGMFFGVYPARKAALLNPIEALRSE